MPDKEGETPKEGGNDDKDGGGGEAKEKEKKGCCPCCEPKGDSKVQPEDGGEGEDEGASPMDEGGRGCRDVLCVIIFGAFWLGMFVVALVASAKGDPMRLVKGTDFNGDTCGGGKHPLRELTYYPRLNQDLMEAAQKGGDPTKVSLYGLCVRKCPAAETFVCRYDEEEKMEALIDTSDEEAVAEYAAEKEDKFFQRGPCWYVPLESSIALSRCLPKPAGNITSIKRCQRPKDEGGGFYAYVSAGAGKYELQPDSPDLSKYYVRMKNNQGCTNRTDGAFIGTAEPTCFEPGQKCKTTVVQTLSITKRPSQPNPMVEKLQAFAAVVGRWFADLRTTGQLIVMNGGLMPLMLGLVFLMAMKYAAKLVVWAIVVLLVVMSAALSLVLADKGGLLEGAKAAAAEQGGALASAAAAAEAAVAADESAAIDAETAAKQQANFRLMAWASIAVTAVLFLIVLSQRKKINITVGIIRSASNAVKAMPTLIVFPMIPFLMLVLLLAYWLFVAAGIASADSISVGDIANAAGELADAAGSLVPGSLALNGTCNGPASAAATTLFYPTSSDCSGRSVAALAAHQAQWRSWAAARLVPGAANGACHREDGYFSSFVCAPVQEGPGGASHAAFNLTYWRWDRPEAQGCGAVAAGAGAGAGAGADADPGIAGAVVRGCVALKTLRPRVNMSEVFAGAPQVSPDKVMRAVQAYHFFGFLWTNNLIQAISMCTIAGSVARFYWTKRAPNFDRDEGLPPFTVVRSFFRCFRYHMGSLIFGALIIAIVQFVRAVIMYLDDKTKGLQDKNKMLKLAFKVVQVCMMCVEKVLKFISKNAYIMIAMKGKGFCSSTFMAFGVLLSNIAQVGMVTVISGLLLLMAKIAIAATCALATFRTLTEGEEYAKGGLKELSSPMVPCIITTMLAFFVGNAFLNVYGMAIDTILLCFCVDKDRKGEKKYMSPELERYIDDVSGKEK